MMGAERQAAEGPLISVIVPVYNTAGTVERCLRSLLGQTYENLEILVMDDGSTDGSGQICDRLAREDSRIRVIHTENQGVARARNQALSAYAGECCMFADADDFVCGEYVRRLYENLVRCGTAVSTCEGYDCLPEEAGQFQTPERQEPRIVTIEEYDLRENSSHRVIWGAVYTREILEGLTFSEQYHCSTDTLFFVQVMKRCRRAAHTGEKLYCYIQYPVSVSKGRFDRKKYSDILVWEEAAAMLAQEHGIAGKSARDMVVIKHARALDRLRKEGSEDRELARLLRRGLRKRSADVLRLPASAARRFGILMRAYLPRTFACCVRLAGRD